MLHLQAGVHLHEPDAIGAQAPRGVSDEFDRPGALIVHGLRGADGGGAQGGAGLLIHARRGGLFDHLLVPALKRTVALEEVDDVAGAVTEHLDLDVTWAGYIGFQQHTIIAEGRDGLAPGAGQGGGERLGAIDPAHALATAAGHSLDQHRPADGRRLGGEA